MSDKLNAFLPAAIHYDLSTSRTARAASSHMYSITPGLVASFALVTFTFQMALRHPITFNTLFTSKVCLPPGLLPSM